MNRKQKALEERYRTRSEWKKPKQFDFREECDIEEVIRTINFHKKWGYKPEDVREYLVTHYKNGGKMYDTAMELLQSPLYKALS